MANFGNALNYISAWDCIEWHWEWCVSHLGKKSQRKRWSDHDELAEVEAAVDANVAGR